VAKIVRRRPTKCIAYNMRSARVSPVIYFINPFTYILFIQQLIILCYFTYCDFCRFAINLSRGVRLKRVSRNTASIIIITNDRFQKGLTTYEMEFVFHSHPPVYNGSHYYIDGLVGIYPLPWQGNFPTWLLLHSKRVHRGKAKRDALKNIYKIKKCCIFVFGSAQFPLDFNRTECLHKYTKDYTTVCIMSTV